jgi:NTP pyrophosphatase (non-canonical NTP hydrolase)
MNFSELREKALSVQKQFDEVAQVKYGRPWTREEIALGFIGDIGDLMKLLIAENNVRDIPDKREKLAHELSDCLWSVIVLSERYEIDLEQSFVATMDKLESKLGKEKIATQL